MFGSIRMERGESVAFCVADWGVAFEQPADSRIGFVIPESAEWKPVPTDPK